MQLVGLCMVLNQQNIILSLCKRYEFHLWGPHLSMPNRTIQAVMRVDYCRLWQRISKEGYHEEDSTSCKLNKYILSFPRTWNAWTWSWHIFWRPRNNSSSKQGHNTKQHPWLHSCESHKILNNNVIGLTFIHPNTQVSTIKSGRIAVSENVHDNMINATATKKIRQK